MPHTASAISGTDFVSISGKKTSDQSPERGQTGRHDTTNVH